MDTNRTAYVQSDNKDAVHPSRSDTPPDSAALEIKATSPELWRRALHACGQATIIIDATRPDLPIIFCNAAFERMTGYSAPEVQGKPCLFLQGADTDRPTLERIHTALKQGRDITETLLNYRKDETPFWNRLTITALHNEAGHLTHFIAVQMDMTDSIWMEEQSKRLFAEGVADTLREPMVVLDAEFQVVAANRAFYRMFQVAPQEATGRLIYTLRDGQWNIPALRELLETRLAESERLDDFEMSQEFTSIGRKTMLLNVCRLKQEGNRPERILLAIEDISRRKSDERALRAHQADIELLNERLRRAMTETHHRVKNSLQILLAMLDMRVMEGNEMVSIAEVARLELHIQTLAAIHELLTRQAKEDGQAVYVSVRDVMENLLPLIQRASGPREIHFSVMDIEMPAQQVTSLAFVVNELVSNALKHGEGKVEVDLAVSKRDNEICVTVYNGGPGFPQGFDPMQAAKTGLELVERLVRWDLRGKTRYETRPEGGARVVITMPYRR